MLNKLSRIMSKLRKKPQDPSIRPEFRQEWRQKWLKANGFPEICQECGQNWVSHSQFPLNLPDWALVSVIWPRTVHVVKPDDDRILELYCPNGHCYADSYDTRTQVKV